MSTHPWSTPAVPLQYPCRTVVSAPLSTPKAKPLRVYERSNIPVHTLVPILYTPVLCAFVPPALGRTPVHAHKHDGGCDAVTAIVSRRRFEVLTPPTSSPGLGSPLPHLRRDWAHPDHICAGTGRTPTTSAPGLGSPRPHLRRDWAHPAHICAGIGLTPPTSAPGRNGLTRARRFGYIWSERASGPRRGFAPLTVKGMGLQVKGMGLQVKGMGLRR
jgi:hypothetical protein